MNLNLPISRLNGTPAKPVAPAIAGKDDKLAGGFRDAIAAMAAPDQHEENCARELTAMHTCCLELRPLDAESRRRALRWVCEVLQIKNLDAERG